MISIFERKPVCRAAMVFILAAVTAMAAPLCLAESNNAASPTNLDKHARKVYHELARFPAGSYVRLTLTDGSERTVEVVSLDETSFVATNAETNNRETHSYSEIDRVRREKDYIGEGSETHVHRVRLWVPIALGVLAAGAAFTAAEVR